jgi:TRAP-type C4-dicarboxylate transport system permease small subunit
MAYVATAVLGLMVLLTTADVLLRYIFRSPITGAYELTEFMMVVVAFPALAWCAVKGGHVKVDLVMSRLPPRVQSIVDSITLLAALGTYVIMTWQGAMQANLVKATSSLLRWPHVPFYWVMALGLAVLCLAIVTLVIKNIAEAVKK